MGLKIELPRLESKISTRESLVPSEQIVLCRSGVGLISKCRRTYAEPLAIIAFRGFCGEAILTTNRTTLILSVTEIALVQLATAERVAI